MLSLLGVMRFAKLKDLALNFYFYISIQREVILRNSTARLSFVTGLAM
jgi:hypothetical protein